MNPPKMPIHIGDFLRETGHLAAAGIGAYVLLQFHQWANGELPTDDEQLARIARLSPSEWKKLGPILAKLFGEGWRHGGVEEGLAKAKQNYEARAKAGSEGGKAKAQGKQNPSNARAELEQKDSIALATLNLEPSTKEETSSLRSDGARKRGARLPEEWGPSCEDWSEAIKRLTVATADQELLKFKDYWKAQPGQRGVKLDWDATWRNWIRNAKGQPNGHGTHHPAANESRSTAILAGVAAAAERRFGGRGQGAVAGTSAAPGADDPDFFGAGGSPPPH